MYIQKISFSILFLFSLLFLGVNAQDVPPPPLVDIITDLQDNLELGKEAQMKLEVTANEDLHLEIGILIPEGISFQKGEYMVRPYRERDPQKRSQRQKYKTEVIFHIGEIKKGETKSFFLNLSADAVGTYEIAGHVFKLVGPWGSKESVETLTISSSQA